MQKIIIPTLDAVVRRLRESAEELGLKPEHIARTYDPRFKAEKLADEEDLSPRLLVFLASTDTESELMGGVEKTVSCAVEFAQYVEENDNEHIDPVIEHFETIQNIFEEIEVWDDEPTGWRFHITKRTPRFIAPQNVLAAKIVLCHIDLDVTVYVEA